MTFRVRPFFQGTLLLERGPHFLCHSFTASRYTMSMRYEWVNGWKSQALICHQPAFLSHESSRFDWTMNVTWSVHVMHIHQPHMVWAYMPQKQKIQANLSQFFSPVTSDQTTQLKLNDNSNQCAMSEHQPSSRKRPQLNTTPIPQIYGNLANCHVDTWCFTFTPSELWTVIISQLR